MKLSLVVASGVHTGKAIPITVPQFVIGRDPQCQLRPASPSISKRHCAIIVRGSEVFIRDFGSTNGTFANGKLVEGEVALKDGDAIKVGPLDFKVQFSKSAPASKPAPKPEPATIGGEPEQGETVVLSAQPSAEPESEQLAALLLGSDDEPAAAKSGNTLGPEEIPEGSTVMEVPVPGEGAGKPGAPAAPAKKAASAGNTSDAAAEILKRYQRRPRT